MKLSRFHSQKRATNAGPACAKRRSGNHQKGPLRPVALPGVRQSRRASFEVANGGCAKGREGPHCSGSLLVLESFYKPELTKPAHTTTVQSLPLPREGALNETPRDMPGLDTRPE
jgi:hypothetical protein